jgi:hypothetical protein
MRPLVTRQGKQGSSSAFRRLPPFAPLSTAAIDQIVGVKATARLVPPKQAAERGDYRLVVTEKDCAWSMEKVR